MEKLRAEQSVSITIPASQAYRERVLLATERTVSLHVFLRLTWIGKHVNLPAHNNTCLLNNSSLPFTGNTFVLRPLFNESVCISSMKG
jgi:hypothetical protein